jgi:hypothetical protein
MAIGATVMAGMVALAGCADATPPMQTTTTETTTTGPAIFVPAPAPTVTTVTTEKSVQPPVVHHTARQVARVHRSPLRRQDVIEEETTTTGSSVTPAPVIAPLTSTTRTTRTETTR